MKHAVNKILEINNIIKSLDPALQEKASEVLINMAFGNANREAQVLGRAKQAQSSASKKFNFFNEEKLIDRPEFFKGHAHDRLKDNVHLIVAWLYSRYGIFSVETKIVRETARRVGLPIPNRPDNTMRQAKCKGQALYQHEGRGWQLTGLGERYVQQRYDVKCGNNTYNEEAVFDELFKGYSSATETPE